MVFCLYPETSRRTLEDMDYIFESNPGALVCGKPELTQRNRPHAFIEAEARRIEQAQKTKEQAEVLGTKKAGSIGVTHLETKV